MRFGVTHMRGRGGTASASSLKRPRPRALVAISAALALAVSPFLFVQSAQAVTYTFLIDSVDVSEGAADAQAGDGVCATAEDTCTMRAALEESNALDLPAGAVEITVAEGFAGNIGAGAEPAAYMQNEWVSVYDQRAQFLVTAPVTIDLKNQLTLETQDNRDGALFHANGPDITFRNMTQALSGGSSFVMGPNAERVTIDGGSSVTQNRFGPKRFVLFREGARSVTVQNYTLQGFGDESGETGVFYVNAQNSTPVENIVIDNVQVPYPEGGRCNAGNPAACRSSLLQFSKRSRDVVVNGFSFTNSVVTNLTDRSAFPFTSGTGPLASVTLSNLNISDNRFINVKGAGTGARNALIALPSRGIGGENTITGNQIVRATSGQGFAVAWNGNTRHGSAGSLRIANNHFNGYTDRSILLENTGDVSVEQNTFGTRSESQKRPAIKEETGDGRNLLVDNQNNANGGVNTWYPSRGASVLTAEAQAGSVQVGSSLPPEAPVCVATLDVVAPKTKPVPAAPVDLDVYWTQDHTAEVYLGRASELTGASASLLLNLPVGPQEIPSAVLGETEATTIVDADTGAASGYLRVQTIVSDSRQSSQYSRLVGVSGNCLPELTIDQRSDQNDPTLARDLRYTVKSSLPLNPDSMTEAAIDLTAEAVTDTTAADRLNPRVVSVTPVEGEANRQFEVVARVDDSALVTAGIAAGSVQTAGGFPNSKAATSTDASITFTNPVKAHPGFFTLVTGRPDGNLYGFTLATGAPKPAADLTFAAVPDDDAVENGVELSQVNAVIPAGKTDSEKVRVTAGAGEVAPNTPVYVNHSVSSEDTNYDGLVVNSLLVKLFSTDPSVNITKRAFTDVSDASTPAQIMATGTEALAGARLADGQTVCFVYEVANTSTDDWATVLTDVKVTDSDARLGEAGLIGSIESLGIGQSTQLAACGSLTPIDTTVGGVR